MKKIYRPLIKGTNWALAGILTVLGFSNCEETGGGDMVEYGTPNADYTVKGKVVNKKDGKPIAGIWVSYIPEPEEITLMYGVPAVMYGGNGNSVSLSDEKGEFNLSENGLFDISKPVSVYVTDKDGEANGSFAPDTLQVDFSKAKHTGKQDGWYNGEYTVDVNTVELEELRPSDE